MSPNQNRKSVATTTLLAIAALLATTAPTLAQEVVSGAPALTAADSVVLFQSSPYEAASTAEQHYQGNMNLKQQQEQLPLYMSVFNGPEGKKPFKWFRVNIAGYQMASEKDLNGARAATLDVSGKVQPGGGQILIDAAGEPGATLIFTLRTPAVKLSSVEPTSVQVGKRIIIDGQNFSSDERQDTVLINGKPAQVLSAGANCITARVPAGMSSGPATVQVVVDSVESGKLPVAINSPVPVLTGTDFWMAPPGAALTISGVNFSSNPSNNKVYFGKTAAQVVNASDNSLSVIVPNWAFGGSEINIPVCVIANGVRSANAIRFDIGPKYLGALPPNPGDSYSEGGSQATSQASSQASSQATSQAGSQSTVQSSSQATYGGIQEGPKLQMNNLKY